MPNYVNGTGPFDPQLMVIGEAPGRIENETGIPFSGPTGQMLDEYLYKAGISRSEVYITNVVKYQPPMNDMKKLHLIGVDLDKSAQELWDLEIRRIQPNAILAVGSYAMRAVMGWPLDWDSKKDGYSILNYRGSILKAKDAHTKVIPTIHPAALFKRATYSHDGDDETASGALDYVYSKLIQADIQRAVDESRTADISLPNRSLIICNNSLDLFRFFREYDLLEKVSSDIESINCIPVCVSFAFNRHHAISVPILRHIGNVQLTDMGDNEMGECWHLIDETLTNKKLIGHNFKYDEFKLTLARFTVGNVYSDTLIKTRVLFPELPLKKLHVVSSLWTREPYYKEEGKEFKLGKKPISQLLLYNAKDAAVNFEVDEEQEIDLISMSERFSIPLRDYYYSYQMKKHKFYLAMENNGFNVDLDKKKELKTRYKALRIEAHQKLVESIGHEINVKSAPQMYRLLYQEMKFKALKKAPTSEDAIIRLIGNHCKGSNGASKRIILEQTLEERRIRDQESRYINFSPDYDNRCKTSFNIIATETCRSSTSILKKPMRPKKIGLAFHTISKHGRLAKDIRSMFIPDKGKIFLQADSSQAEARIVFVLAEDWVALEAIDKIDIHRRTAALILGLTQDLDFVTPYLPSDDKIGKDSPERFCGKKTRHAGNYDMKKARFMQEFNTDCQKFEIQMEISEWKAGNMLEKFHAASPRIKGKFHSDIKDAISNSRLLIDTHGGIRIFNGRMDESLFQEAYANLPQRGVGHLVQGAALKVNEELGDEVGDIRSNKPVNWISENHDSLLLQVPENGWEKYAKLLKKHMETPIDFSKYCSLRRDYILTIPCDIEISDTNYAEMRKVKITNDTPRPEAKRTDDNKNASFIDGLFTV